MIRNYAKHLTDAIKDHSFSNEEAVYLIGVICSRTKVFQINPEQQNVTASSTKTNKRKKVK